MKFLAVMRVKDEARNELTNSPFGDMTLSYIARIFYNRKYDTQPPIFRIKTSQQISK